MGNTCGSKLIKEEEFQRQLAVDRREGRALLRKLVTKSDDIDWEEVIKQADLLHRRERKKIGERERHWRRQKRLRSRGRPKKYSMSEDSRTTASTATTETSPPSPPVGAYSVNLLVMGGSDDDVVALKNWKAIAQSRSDTNSSTESREERRTYNTELIVPSMRAT